MSHHHDHGCDCGCEENIKVLFQGDSITDCDRSRDDLKCLGHGYPMFIASRYLAKHPEYPVEFINRGVSGDRSRDLKARWDKDCIEIQPDLVSILVGINDVWRRYDNNDPTSVDQFADNCHDILTRTVESTDAGIILLEPFLLPVMDEQDAWREDLDPKIQVVRALAREFDASLIPLDGLFAQASTKREPEFWSADGVHPTFEGHALIAQAWLDAVDI
ncbi:MAG: SGNH/GDSL hydrolase family protein [Armatimonadota bacterium]